MLWIEKNRSCVIVNNDFIDKTIYTFLLQPALMFLSNFGYSSFLWDWPEELWTYTPIQTFPVHKK